MTIPAEQIEAERARFRDWYADNSPDHVANGYPAVAADLAKAEAEEAWLAAKADSLKGQVGGKDIPTYIQRSRAKSAKHSDAFYMIAEIRDLRQRCAELQLAADRYAYVRSTTTAIRNAETGERIECTPEEFDASVDRCRAASQQKE